MAWDWLQSSPLTEGPLNVGISTVIPRHLYQRENDAIYIQFLTSFPQGMTP